MPVFQDIQGQTGIVTDNGTFEWDEAGQTFKKVSNDLATPEAGVPSPVIPTAQ
jgi:hypothetical protein